MSGKSRRKQKPKRVSSSKSKHGKRVVEGRFHKTKKAKLQCGQCGRWFENLGQINQHYSAVGHKKIRKPPKKIKFSKDYSQEELELVEAMLEMLRNPHQLRKKLRDHLAKRRMRLVVPF